MGLDAYPDIGAVGTGRWDALVGDRAFAGSEWLRFGERVYAAAQHHYLLLKGSLGPGGAVSSVRSTEPLPVGQPVLRALTAGWVRRHPLVLCQLPVAGISGLMLPAGRRAAALREVVEGLKDLLKDCGGSFLVFPYLEKEIAYSRVWGKDFLRVSLPPGTVLPIIWRDFEAYLFSRRNSVRKDYRLHANRAARMRLQTRVVDRLPDPGTALRLIRAVEKSHRAPANPVVPALISEAPSVGGRWLIVEQDGRLVGCGLVLPDRGEYLLTLLGLDRKVSQVYFSLMWGAIRHAIETGAAVLHGGGGAYHFKSRLGYRTMENVHIRAFAAHPLLRRFGEWLALREAAGAAVGRPGASRPFAFPGVFAPAAGWRK